MKIKSLFINVFIGSLLVAWVCLAILAWQDLRADVVFAWFGVSVWVGYFISLYTHLRPRTSDHLGVESSLSLLCVMGTLLTMDPQVARLPFVLVLFLGALMPAIYVRWYSLVDIRGEQPRVDEYLPDFELLDANGERVSQHQLIGKPALWLVIRGNWCPICVAQVKELAKELQQIEAKGIAIYLISVQDIAKTQALAQRFDMPMRCFQDEGGQMSKALGIFHANAVPLGYPGYEADASAPMVMVTNDEGEIEYVHISHNYRVRPEPGQYLKAINRVQ